MCKWIATAILENFSSLYRPAPAVLAGDGTQGMQGQSEVLQPDGRKLVGALGESRKCQPPGQNRLFHDGAGFLSMGRWDVEYRAWSMGDFWKPLRRVQLPW